MARGKMFLTHEKLGGEEKGETFDVGRSLQPPLWGSRKEGRGQSQTFLGWQLGKRIFWRSSGGRREKVKRGARRKQ